MYNQTNSSNLSSNMSKQPLKSTSSTSEGLNLNLPPTTTRSTSNPILPSTNADSDSSNNASIKKTSNQAKSSNQINKQHDNTNISIDNESTSYSPNLEHSSFFSRNYNESLMRLLSSNNSNNNSNNSNGQNESNRLNTHSVLNNLKSLSGTILNSIQKPFQNSNQSNYNFESSHTCNLGYRLNNNLNDNLNNLNDLNRTSIEPLIDSQINDNQYYFSSRYQPFANDSPSFSASSSNNFSFNTVSTNLTNSAKQNATVNDFTCKTNDDQLDSNKNQLNDDNKSSKMNNGNSGSNPGANLLNNNIFKLNLDNLQGSDEQNAFNMSGNSVLNNKQLTIYEKRYLLAVERGDLSGVRRMIEMAPQIEQQEKEKSDYQGPVFKCVNLFNDKI